MVVLSAILLGFHVNRCISGVFTEIPAGNLTPWRRPYNARGMATSSNALNKKEVTVERCKYHIDEDIYKVPESKKFGIADYTESHRTNFSDLPT